MIRSLAELLVCSKCKGSLSTRSDECGRITEGELKCDSCDITFPINNSIPRFVSESNYADSFGYEWAKHARTQVDRYSGTAVSEERFYRQTEWPKTLVGQRILEVGCGSGRFTEIALKTGAELYSLDYSEAVDVNFQNNGVGRKALFLQADLYQLPFEPGTFDKIFCFGVLQHCPDPKRAFLSLVPHLKQGGEIAIDVYGKSWQTFLTPKYYIRPFVRRLSPEMLYSAVEKVVPVLLPLKVWVRRHLPKIGRLVAGIIPVASFDGYFTLTKQQHLEWSILDTFDDLSPRYDYPQNIKVVKDWCEEAGLTSINVRYISPGIVGAKGTKPKS